MKLDLKSFCVCGYAQDKDFSKFTEFANFTPFLANLAQNNIFFLKF